MRRVKIAFLVTFVLVFLTASIAVAVFHFERKASPVQLPSSEVREYQGEKLSSINDFAEINSIAGIQYVDKDTYRLEISGLVANPGSYTYDQVVDNHTAYQKVVTLNCVDGWSVTLLWEGVRVQDLIDEAQPSPDARVLIFHAADGYTTSLPIEYFRDNNIIMAYKMNGVTIPPERGFPFMLVAESKWGYKWAKWITGIEFSSDTSYKGYWEDRGYSNIGDLNQPFLQ
ncbi:MAG: molybdopterin-dependent oxidoreductase [Dehalococcoidia bacterium]|jgi:DMSO/TMAO reductase YedYZ molybdopterin-dependent catalytic subunit